MLLACPDCNQRERPLVYFNTDPLNGDLYRCPLCGGVWYEDELGRIYKRQEMYSYENPTVDKYKQMEHMLIVLLPAYLVRNPDEDELAARIIQEFANMEAARQTIVEVPDTAQAIIQYLDHHFKGTAKPDWYKSLTE